MNEKIFQNCSVELTQQQEALAELVTYLHFEQHPQLEINYGQTGKDRCKQDCLFHLSYLSESIRLQSREVFLGYLKWAQVMLQSRNIPVEDLINNLYYLDIACSELLHHEHYQIAKSYIDEGAASLEQKTTAPVSFLTTDNPLLPYAQQYLSLLLDAKRNEAQVVIDELVQNGHVVSDIYEYIFAATQYEVGHLWQTNKITVAQEHYCTAATQLIMSTLYPLIFNARRTKHKMLGCTVSGGLHELGIRMISDLFERDGWDTYYMGANMPDAGIISALKEQQADLLAISVSLSFDIRKAELLINKIKSDDAMKNVKIIVGGPPFNLIPELWKKLGADGWAKDAISAIKVANQLMLK